MKIKNCEVLLVSENKEEVLNWLEQIKLAFTNVRNSDIREVFFNVPGEKEKDYRTNVWFSTVLSKPKTYEKMNAIKANPIKFY